MLTLWGLAAAPASAEDPALPQGLGTGTREPALPVGLSDGTGATTTVAVKPATPWFLDAAGFLDARAGWRLQSDPKQQARSLSELRLQLQLAGGLERATFHITSDMLYDDLAANSGIDLERGQGPIDLRDASLAWRPSTFMDIKLGRQILSWGTGDLIFINDLFPKDYQAFFLGRDSEYLKAPSDAGKVSLFFGGLNLDLVYMPRFDPDRFLDGSRVSFFGSAPSRVVIPNDPEFAARLYGNIGANELAAYAYHGFWKSPNGFDPGLDAAIFPTLSVYGFSLRGPTAGGIANLEAGYYDSRADRDGTDPRVRNSELRILLGYQRELARNLTIGMQGQLEHMHDYRAYRRSLPRDAPQADQDRYLLTLRLTRELQGQDLRLSLFTFYSPTDADGYLRPQIHYRVTDHLALESGANLFFGNRDETFFGQLEDNSNLYFAVRYSFAAEVHP